MAVADGGERRVVLAGMSSVRGIDVDGRPLFEVPLGDFAFSEAVSVRLAPSASPHLAILAAAPRELHRGRFLLLSPDTTIVYDEIREKPVRLLTLRHGDGRETLLVSGDGLRAVRPRAAPAAG